MIAILLSGCILFPPFWFPTDPIGPGSQIVVANDTDADWVLTLGGEFGSAFAIGAGDVGTVDTFGMEPQELVLLDPDCAEVDRLDWDASAESVRITDPGTLSVTDEAPPDADTVFIEYFDCFEESFGAPPEPGTALPEAGGAILLSTDDGSAYILDVASATVTPLGEKAGDLYDIEHAWSPDGSHVAFSRASMSDFETGVYVANADGSGAELLVEDASSPRWSPDGTAIAYLGTDPFAGGSVLSVIEVDAGEPLELSEDGSPASWSPDGQRIAFMSVPGLDTSFEVPPGELRIVNADGSGLETLADAAPFAPPPAWSPDGSRLAFVALAEGADPGSFDVETVIAVHDLGTGETSVLAAVDGAGLGEPTWSPDGETIAFTIMTASLLGSSGALATVTATGGPITRVIESSATLFSTPLWSPDGEWLAVARADDSYLTGELIAIRPDGTDETVLATGLVYATTWRANPP